MKGDDPADAGSSRRSPEDETWRDWMRHLGRHQRRVREFLGLSQYELARRAGVSQGAVSRFESGRGVHTPFLVILRLHLVIAEALRAIDPDTLDDQVKQFMNHMEFLCVPKPGSPPAPAGVSVPQIQLTKDPDVELLVRRYRALPEAQRRAFAAAVASMTPPDEK